MCISGLACLQRLRQIQEFYAQRGLDKVPNIRRGDNFFPYVELMSNLSVDVDDPGVDIWKAWGETAVRIDTSRIILRQIVIPPVSREHRQAALMTRKALKAAKRGPGRKVAG